MAMVCTAVVYYGGGSIGSGGLPQQASRNDERTSRPYEQTLPSYPAYVWHRDKRKTKNTKRATTLARPHSLSKPGFKRHLYVTPENFHGWADRELFTIYTTETFVGFKG